MSNLHAPTVPSGPTSTGAAADGVGKLTFPQLQRKKDDLEAELKALGRVLDSHNVDMKTPLVTDDGFPRADIDVAQIRTTRARIIHMRNDYKSLMDEIEKRLHARFASLIEDPTEGAQQEQQPASAAAEDVPRDAPPQRLDPVFAKVDSVVDGSPAAAAGLRVGDEIRNFGYVSRANNDGLKRVAECVQGNEDHDVVVKICRRAGSEGGAAEEAQLTLRPRRDWGGRGLLGCHIVPL